MAQVATGAAQTETGCVNVNAVRHAIAAALATPAMHVSAYAHSQPTPPGVQILPPAVTYDLTMVRGHDEWVFTIQGFVSEATWARNVYLTS